MKIQKKSKIITIKAEILSIHEDERKVFIDYEGRKMILLLNKDFESTFNFIKDFFTSSDSVVKIDRLAVSLINVKIDKNEVIFNQSLHSYIILEPSWLVTVTALTQFDFYERSLFNKRFSEFKPNQHTLLGNIVHEVFEDIITDISIEKRALFKQLNKKLENSIKKNIVYFAMLDLNLSNIKETIKNHLNALYLYIKKNKGFNYGKEVLSEHYIIDTDLGLKGKIDSVIMNEEKIIAVELKTGKSWKRHAKTGHAFQAQAYSLLLENKYKNKKVMPPLIVYSGDYRLFDLKVNSEVRLGMKVDLDYKAKVNVINLRNKLIVSDIIYNQDYDHARFNECDKCFHLPRCECVNNVELKSNYTLKPLLLDLYRNFSVEEKSFFKDYNSYLTEESVAIKKDLSGYFDSRNDCRVNTGKCVEIESIISQEKNSILLKCNNQSELRERDMCLISDIEGPIKGQCAQVFISSIFEDSIKLNLHKPINFVPKWIDAMRSDSIFDNNYPSIFNILNNSNLKTLKNILINKGTASNNKLVEFDYSDAIFEFNHSQKSAIKLALGVQDFLLIQGPPGTGKTSTIAKIVQELHNKGKTVLLSCFTHRAIDELMKKIQDLDSNINLYKIGTFGIDNDLVSVKEFNLDTAGSEIKDIRNKILNRPIYIGTSYAWLSGKYDDLIGSDLYDVAIIDEASQMIMPNSVGVIRLAKSFILVGDHFQQPPIINSLEAEKLSQTLFQNLFNNEELPENTKVMLDIQHRMNPVIGDFISKTFYNNQLKNNESLKFNRLYQEPDKPSTISKICDPDDVITLVHTENHNHAVVGKSLEEDAEIILDLIEFLIKKGVKPRNIGVIAPYRAQVALIRRKIEKFISREDLEFYSKEMVDTIDRFQGNERDVIIFSMCLSDSIDSNLLKDKRKINVALSRAKKKLIVVGNWDLGNQNSIFNSLFEYVEDTNSCKIIRI
tara:strand:+ start:1206 stop:4058 length:2853 start_codon:yes stop_codon:yes gene_type:complete